MKRPLLLGVTIAIGMAFCARLLAADSAVESWADPNLPVHQGLSLWLDASRLSAARQQQGKTEVKDGDRIDLWPDASGGMQHVIQRNEEAQPRFGITDQFQAVRFDGLGSFLSRQSDGVSFQAVTIFVVAAPYENRGMFSAFLSLAPNNGNDFQRGINIDQGGAPSRKFEVVSIEGTGASGSRDLYGGAVDFGNVVRLGVVSAAGPASLNVFVDGEQVGTRDRVSGDKIEAEQLVIGARYYTAFGGPPQKGFLHGDIAEVLIYNRVLSADERRQVDEYLENKYGKVGQLPIPVSDTGGKPLLRVKDPPSVQMFVPGFTVRRLPLELTNINNVLYRPDGKLVALGYDGKIYLLSDTDGDGLEDKATLFWANDGDNALRAPIGMALTPPNYKHGQGVFVPAKGKCSLIVDTNGDDVADKEIIVADGWPELFHGVDALGVDVDPRDGTVYFGLGTQNFTNAYLVENGQAKFSLESERGTILKVAPDFKSRAILATGIRFPVGIRLNKDGDVFCSDQEGATWLPNGNPFDELLHVQQGRHYGFPPRHPKHLPGVIDEPSTYDYRPQHQSTCGLNFNEPVNGGPVFGPQWWTSDCIMTGYSRGKIFRAKLIKTDAGYVVQNQTIACLNMLPADACVSPAGDLVIAAHSGGPDWGSGPTGMGSIFKVAYDRQDLAQPSLIWAHSPQEIRVALDRPIDTDQLAGLKASAVLEYGRYVSAGDRFESLWPGYQVVQNQQRTPRYELRIHAVQVTPDLRTLIIGTDRHPENVDYALALPGMGRVAESPQDGYVRPQIPESDLQYDLSGVQASWTSANSETQWSGWLPHLDLNVAREFTSASADHASLFRDISQAEGELTLKANLDLKDMLRPAVQPGEKIDYQWPSETVTVTFRSKNQFTLKTTGAADAEFVLAAESQGDEFVAMTEYADRKSVPVEILLNVSGGTPDLRVDWHTAEDATLRAFPLIRIRLPWAPTTRLEDTTIDIASIPELQGGDWSNGRKLFFSEEAACAKCHAVRGEGGKIGPDLSNLPHRDYASVYRDIARPSFAINPDFLSQVIVTKEGQILTGVVRTVEGKLLVGDADGKVTELDPTDIDERKVGEKSVMPEKVLDKLGSVKTRDLLTFLLVGPPRMPDYGPQDPPAPRPRSEVVAVLAGSETLSAEWKELNVVLVSGRKDHGPGEHDYPAWQVMWQRLMSLAPNTTTETADTWPSKEQLESADVLVFYQQGTWNAERARDIDAFLKRGGGLVYIHYAVDGGQDAPGFAQRIGLAWKGGASAFRHGGLDLGFDPAGGHPIARNFETLHLHDESYWQLLGDPQNIRLIATGVEAGKPQPLFWTMQPSHGRVFVSIPGHFSWSFDDPLFRLILLRGIAWSANEPVDRFNDLVYPGARIAE